MDSKDRVERYKHLRGIQKELNSRLFKRFVSKKVLEKCTRRLGICEKGGVMVFDSSHEMDVLVEHYLYDYRSMGKSFVEKAAAGKLVAQGAEERSVLSAMSRSRYSLFGVVEVLPGTGVRLHDLLRDEKLLMVDLTLSESEAAGMGLATRIIPFDDLMSSGAPIPFLSDQAEDILREFEWKYPCRARGAARLPGPPATVEPSQHCHTPLALRGYG